MEMTVTLDFEKYISVDDLEDNVIRQLADSCMAKLSGGHTESFHKMCVDAINLAISDKINAKVEDMLSRPIQARDRFGDPIEGVAEKSLGDMLGDAVEAAMTETVDREGRPKKSTYHDKAIPRMQWHLSKLLAREIDIEAAKAIKELKADAKEKVRKQIAAAVAAQLTK